MLKILLGTLIAWLVTSCSMEEPNDSGILVDNDHEIEVPDWVSVEDVDLDRSGVIDIKDLVIASKFFGQEVPNRDQVISAGDGSEYVYKVLSCRKTFLGRQCKRDGHNMTVNSEFTKTPIKLTIDPSFENWPKHGNLAFRFRITNDTNVAEVKVKSLHKNPFIKTPTTHLLDTYPAGHATGASCGDSGNFHSMGINSYWSVSSGFANDGGYVMAGNTGNHTHATTRVFDFYAHGISAYSKISSDAGGDLGQIYINVEYFNRIDDKKIYEHKAEKVGWPGFQLTDFRDKPIQIGKTTGTNPFGGTIRSGRISYVNIVAIRTEDEFIPYEKVGALRNRNKSISIYNKLAEKGSEQYLADIEEARTNPSEESLEKAEIEKVMANAFSYQCFDNMLPEQRRSKGSPEGLSSAEVRAKHFPEDIE